MRGTEINRFLLKIDRINSYILAFLMFLYFLSGYGMTKGIIEPVFAKALHEVWLPLPFFFCFLLHFLTHFRFLLKKHIKDEIWTNVYVIALSLALLIFFFYLYLL